MARRLKNLPTTDKKFIVVRGLNKKKVVNPFYAGDYSFTDERPATYKRSNNEGTMKMARRGRKAKAANASRRVSRRQRTVGALRGLFGTTPYSETKSYGPRKPRGRRPGSKNKQQTVAPVIVVQEAAQTTRRRRASSSNPRVRAKQYKTGYGPNRPSTFGRAKSRAVNYFSRFKKGNKTMPRGRKGNKGSVQPSYSQVTSSLPIQVGQTVSEALFSLLSVGTDVYTASTASKADDLAFPVIEWGAATVGRYVSQKYLARRHPGLAAVTSSGFSAMNGDRIGTMIRARLDSFLKPSGPPSGGPKGA